MDVTNEQAGEKVVIKTDKSWLSVRDFENHQLLKECIGYVNDKLIANPTFKAFGRTCTMRRSIGFFSDESKGYTYSREEVKSQRLGKSLSELLTTVNNIYGADFNGILVNSYSDGSSYISRHADDESTLSSVGVVSVSIGIARKFRIRNKDTGKIVVDIPTTAYTLIHMGGDFQEEFTHEIPKEMKIREGRISLTFRKHNE
jgi:alkylated DNA repair dioxygenase AlkB